MSGLRPWTCLAACTGRFSKGQTKLSGVLSFELSQDVSAFFLLFLEFVALAA